MKSNSIVERAVLFVLLAGLALGGTVAVTPDSKTYLQTELTVGAAVSLPITLSGWGDTNLTVTASGGGTLFTAEVTPAGDAPQSTARTLSLTPKGAAGSTIVTVTVNGSGFAPISAEVALTVTPVPVLSNPPSAVTFVEDSTYTTNVAVTYWGSASSLSWNALITAGTQVLQNASFSGTGLSRTLTLTPHAHQNGNAQVRLTVADSSRSATQMVAVTVSSVPDAPVVLGLPANLLLNEDTVSNHVFTVIDLDAGQSGPISSVATVTGGATSLFSTVTVSGTTLQLAPFDHAYGWATVRVVTANNTVATTNAVRVRVQPVPDAPAVASWPTAPVELSVGGPPVNPLFGALTVTDADHLAFRNGTSNEYLKASLAVSDPTIHFASYKGQATTNLAAGSVPTNVTAWLRSLALYPPESTFAPVGTASTNVLTLQVFGYGSNDTLSVTQTVSVLLLNPNHPPQYIPAVNPSSLREGQTITPFAISQLFDQDAIHTSFTLHLLLRPGDGALATLSSAGPLYGNESELNTQLRNIGLTAKSGVMTTPTTNVVVSYVLSDSIDTVTNSVTLVINQASTAPVINGIDDLTAYYSISDIETVNPFPTVITYDVDQGGQQWLGATVSVSAPGLGSLFYEGSPVSSFPLQSQGDLQNLLRQLTFVPAAGALAIGSSAEMTLTLTVTDVTSLSAVNSSTRIRITAVNKPPSVQVPLVQPVLLAPGGEQRPFVGTTVTNDDLNNVTLTITVDDNDKGTLGNLGGFTFAGGVYTMAGTVDAINASLTNLTYAVNPDYLFPADDPGGTVFTLEAEDYQIKLGRAQVWIQIQDEPRNHLVTQTANDGTPGTLLFALAHAANNDVITFALPEYPAVIRVPEAFAPLVLGSALTLKGPGADLLTLSGDADGDGDADGQIFVVQSRVTIEGLTLAHGRAAFGGAIAVAPEGTLTLRACAIVDCEADEYGGAIDVAGSLLLDRCYLARNRVAATGFGGGAVSFYSSRDSALLNTTFASNRVDNAGGFGGGALNIERDDAMLNVAVTHCTFAGNADASDCASAVYVVGGNTQATLKNNIFSDFSAQDGARNLDVTGDGWIASAGGNVCDDSTRTAYQQAGGTSVFLLTHVTDLTEVPPGLSGLSQARGDPTPAFALQPGSPALGQAQGQDATADQRERIRRGSARDSGSVQQNAVERAVITELHLSTDAGETDPFVELYVPRDGQTVDLTGFELQVNGVAVHVFGQGQLALTNSVYTALVAASSVPASYLLTPGRGVVVTFPKGALADFTEFASLNPTPVVRASIATNAAALAQAVPAPNRGAVALVPTATAAPVVLHTFLTDFVDPEAETGTNRLDTAHNSIASAPQGRGFAFLPHSSVSRDPFGGWRGRPAVTAGAVRLLSPGAAADGTPFGFANSIPLAVPDAFTVSEDAPAVLDVLANDYDADGGDVLVVVDLSPDHASGGDDATALSADGAPLAVQPGTLHTNAAPPVQGATVVYEPRDVLALQALPAGAKRIDTFYYSILDIGSGTITNYAAGGGDVRVASPGHRLTNGTEVVVSGSADPAYNGTHTVTAVDDDTFTLDGVAFSQNLAPQGAWRMTGARLPSDRSQALASVTVLGANDPPAPAPDWIGGIMETSIVRVIARPALAGTPVAYEPDPLFSAMPTILPDNLLGNDDDVDTDDDADSLSLVGVVMEVFAISGYSGTPGLAPVTVLAPGHGLETGTTLLIAGYGGHPSYNGYWAVTVLDDDRFSLPLPFVDDHAAKGVWTLLDDGNRYQGVTDRGAVVKLDLRGDRNEDNVVFDASVSASLRTLQEGEVATNVFYVAVADSHGAIGLAPVHMIVTGINQTPEPADDPDGLQVLAPLLSPSNTLEQTVTRLELLYPQPAANGEPDRVNLHASDPFGTLSGVFVISNLWSTDERTALTIDQSRLLANDADIDTLDVLSVAAVEPLSREQAAVSLDAGVIRYDPAVATETLRRLARGEWVIDTFRVAVSDGMTGGTATSVVCVAVVGLNDTPVALPDAPVTSEDDPYFINPLRYPVEEAAQHDIEVDVNGAVPDNRLLIDPQAGIVTPGQAAAELSFEGLSYDPTVSELLNQLADWQSYLDTITYTVNDHSMIFACDDEFRLLPDVAEAWLNVLANDRDYTGITGGVHVAAVGVSLRGATVAAAADGAGLVYTPPAGFVGEDLFTYTVTNAIGDADVGVVRVVVEDDRVNGDLRAADDRFAVAFGESVALDVLANDDLLPSTGAGLTLSRIVSTTVPGQPVLDGGVLTLTTSVLQPQVSFVYEITGSGGAAAQARATVDIVDRRGTLTVLPDTFSVRASSVDNTLDVLANDGLLTAATGAWRLQSVPTLPTGGSVALSGDRLSLLYTPLPGFVGRDTFAYQVSDGLGGTGTATVEVWVGTPVAANDFVTVAATNGVAVTNVAVRANDRIWPDPEATLVVLSVTPTNSALGTVRVSEDGSALVVTTSNAVGQVEYTYTVADASLPGRTATARLTLQVAGTGIHAANDEVVIVADTGPHALDVLANDITFPHANRTYSIVGVGAGGFAPQGAVSVAGNKLVYTPPAGFVGTDAFTYTLSDDSTTDTALVTVRVLPGTLQANADTYAVYFEVPSGATEADGFDLAVVLNDRCEPALGATLAISGIGVDDGLTNNAPSQGGSVTINPGGQTLRYRPAYASPTNYVETFTYQLSDGGTRRAKAQVTVWVQNRAGALTALTSADLYHVHRNSADNSLPVLANDGIRPGAAAGWTLTGVTTPEQGGTAVVDGTIVRYTPPANFVGEDAFSYSVHDTLGGTGTGSVRVRVGQLRPVPDTFAVMSATADNRLNVVANDPRSPELAEEYTVAAAFGADQGGSVAVDPDLTHVLYTPASSHPGPYPYVERFLYVVDDDTGGVTTGRVDVAVHLTGSDRSTTNITTLVLGRNDIPVILNAPPNPTITDKETARPFTGVTVVEVDQQTLEPVDVTVTLDDAAKGTLQDLGGFVDLGNGRYGLVGATAAAATDNLRNLLFVPTENRITVPETEPARFTLEVTDNKSDPVADTQTVVRVTAVNDAPVIAGTRAGQTVYAAMPIRLFAAVTITEVDDLTLQPLTVTVQLSDPANGVLQNLGSFAALGGGAYRATGLTAAQATQQVRALEFLYGAGRVAANLPQLTVFTLTVEDGFAPPVADGQTSVWAYSPDEGRLRPAESVLRSTFGFSVDTCLAFAVAGAPGANANGTDSGSALVYRLVPGTTNTWTQWRQLQPPGVDVGDEFGYAVSISDELIAVGAIDDEVGAASVGAVYLFGRNVGGVDNWGLLHRLTPTNLPAGSRFGFSVDVAGDLLAVGAPRATLSGASPAEGAVLLFGRDVGGPGAWGEIRRWEPRGQSSIECGWSVSLDGDRLAAGAPRNKAGTPAGDPKGAVFCFARDAGGAGAWGLSQTIRLGAVTNADSFGYSVSVKGALLAVGAPSTQVPGGITEAGVVYVFAAGAGGDWAQAARLDAAADRESRFGQCVSLSGDLLFIGAPGYWTTAEPGSAYLFRRTAPDGAAWLLAERLQNPQLDSRAHFGSAVSLCQTVGIVGMDDHIFDLITPEYSAYMYRFKFNNAPVVTVPVDDQFAEWGEPFAFTVPDGGFADPDLYDVLTVRPVLPTAGHGLGVDGMTVSGTPTVLGPVPVEVTATDASGATAVEPFDVVVLVDGVLLANTPRNLWNVTHFGKDAADPALEATLWGGAANADGDAANNDAEYAFGGDPTTGDASGRITLTAAPGGNLLLSYVRRRDDPALAYTLQGSATLAPPVWGEVLAWTVGELVTPLDAAYERVEVTISAPLAGPAMYFRVLVTP